MIVYIYLKIKINRLPNLQLSSSKISKFIKIKINSNQQINDPIKQIKQFNQPLFHDIK